MKKGGNFMNISSASPNIFSCLAKGNPHRENFFSDAFVFVMNKLLTSENKRSQEFSRKLLGKICAEDFSKEGNISLTREEKIEDGRIDIRIETPTKLIYVENKIDAGIADQQLERYKSHLDKQQKEIKKIILITKYMVDKKTGEFTDDVWMWYSVYDIIKSLMEKYKKDTLKTDIDLFLIEHLSAYMKEERMTIEKINSAFIEGITSMLNLIEQIRFVLIEKDCQIVSRSAGEKFNGFYFKVNKDSLIQSWIGIFYFDNYRKPSLDQIVFQLNELEITETVSKSELHIEFDRKRFNVPSLLFSFEDSNFFTLEKDEQIQKLREFVQMGIELIQQHRVKKEGSSQF